MPAVMTNKQRKDLVNQKVVRISRQASQAINDASTEEERQKIIKETTERIKACKKLAEEEYMPEPPWYDHPAMIPVLMIASIALTVIMVHA